MFPFTWTVTTSSTQVNASSYWPGNWYDSSTFITNWNWWDSSYNANLWWWVDWNVWKDVESIKYEWKPGSSTVAYFPLTSDFVDVVTWNWPTSSSGTIDFTTKDWVLCASCPSGSVERTYNNRNWSTWNNPLTWHMWCNKNSYSHEWQVMISTGYWATTRCKAMGFHNNQFWTWWWNNDTYHFDAPIWQWALYTWTFDWSTTKAYLNWELKNSKAMTYSVDSNNYSALFSQVIQGSSWQAQSADWYYRDIVIEDRARTADEIVDYYNKTKWTYTWEWWGNDIVNWHSLDEHSMFPQWPCPSGYHVPTKDEWQAVYDILITTFSMAANDTTMRTYLKMPMAGSRFYSTASINSVGNIGYYWSSTPYSANMSYSLYFHSSIISHSNSYRSYGYSIRCFKNIPVIPTSSWTTLYDWSSIASWAWVFYNASLWLISVSGDGVTWYTIQDKNLWATTVYNQWDIVSDANSWYFYQWGNNYWFAHSWTVTNSSTQVDASWYGPWNYYSSSTFIIRTSSPYDWSSVRNDDLWWWVSKSELKQYYSFNLLNEYIWEYHECEVNTMGPCPSGFHIPTRQEWHDLYDIWYALWLWDTTNYWKQLQLQFNMPVCWKLNNDWTYTSSPTDAVYWCADKQSSSYWRDLWLRTTTDVATVDDDTTMIRWGSIRPFRNMPLIPTTSDSNWNIPTGSNPANGWIYDNETEWVISISADWAHWMTLADKNCWATTKWYLNSTMSESNCWKFYQWGNNHWFPFTWATKTSSTVVDASSYWPFSEYYDDDTFIKTSPWDTSDNRNLWGWVSWPTRNCDISWWNKSTEWWFFYSDWVYYWDKYNTKQEKISSAVFNYVFYDRKYDTWRWRNGNTYWLIKSDFSWFDWTTYTLYEWWSWCIIAKWEFIIFSWKASTWTNAQKKTMAFSRSTKQRIYDSWTYSWSYQCNVNLYSYLSTSHRYVSYGTWNASYAFITDLTNSNNTISRSWWYNQADEFFDKILLLSENASLWIQIRDIDNDNTLASYQSTTYKTWSIPDIFLFDSWLVDNYSSSNSMYWKIAITWCRSNKWSWAIADMINNTITANTMKSNWWIRWMFIPYTERSWYTHIVPFWWDYGTQWFTFYNSSNWSYSEVAWSWWWWFWLNIFADWSIFYKWNSWYIWDIETETYTTDSSLYWYVWKYCYRA